MIFGITTGDPVSDVIATSVGVICLMVIFRNTRCAIALILSLVGGLGLSAYGLEQWHGLVMCFCILVCVGDFRDRKPTTISLRDNEVNYLLAVIYVVRTFLRLGEEVFSSSLTDEFFWVASMLFLIVQAGLVAGDSFNGISERLNDGIYRIRSNLFNSNSEQIGNDAKGINQNDN